jgi:hypothetical protein
MLTDSAPFDYVYLSPRLLTDLVHQDEAARGRWSRSFDIDLRLFGLHLQRRAPDFTNPRDLAARSTGLVSDYTGSIEVPGIYVHGRVNLRHGVFSPHMGWSGGQVACYCGVSATSEGSVFVALFGSASNVVGRRRADHDRDSFYPSDAAGLYALLDAVRELDDPEIDLDYRIDDHAMSAQTRAERAVMFARGGASVELGELEFLARVYLDVEDYAYADDAYRRVIMGAPLWVATPRPAPSLPPARAAWRGARSAKEHGR